MGLVVLTLFTTSVATTCGALASGGREQLLTTVASILVKLALMAAVAFMFAFSHLSQFENKSLTLRAVLYPILAFGIFTLFRLRGMRGPYPMLIDLCWSFTFTFDIVSNDLHWYGTWKHWDDFVHFLNSVPFAALILITLLALERRGSMRLGFWGAALVGLAVYTSAHAVWEMYEFSMDRFADTNLQPGGMDEATRNNVSGIAGALVGVLLVWHWRRSGSLERTAVEPLVSYLRAVWHRQTGCRRDEPGLDGRRTRTSLSRPRLRPSLLTTCRPAHKVSALHSAQLEVPGSRYTAGRDGGPFGNALLQRGDRR
jgi:hypothetical protein